MVVESSGYHTLIEFLAENLALFESAQKEHSGEQTIEDIVMDLIATHIMAVFEQNPELESDVRFQLLKDADAVVADLNEVLAGVWRYYPTNQQIRFLEEYIGLVKNLFDTAISSY